MVIVPLLVAAEIRWPDAPPFLALPKKPNTFRVCHSGLL
jgi:hypothetical protein